MNLQTTINLDFKAFLRWWGAELAFLVPKKIWTLFNSQTFVLIFNTDSQGIKATLLDSLHPEHPLYTETLDTADSTAWQKFKLQHPQTEKVRLILRLSGTQAISKILHLPEAAQENLQQVVRFELDRYTPFKAEQIYFTVLPLGKTEFGQLQVLLTFTPKTHLDDALEALKLWGVKPDAVDCQSLNARFPQLTHKYNLLPEQHRQTPNRLMQTLTWSVNSLLVILLAAVLIYPINLQKQAVDILKSRIKAQEKQALLVASQQQAMDTLQEQAQHIIDIRQNTAQLIDILNELSQLVKNDTWLTNLQYADNHLQIQGQSPAASTLISTLEASPYFSNVSFASPLTQDKASGLERFQLTMNVSPVSIPPTPAPPTASDAAPAAEENTQ